MQKLKAKSSDITYQWVLWQFKTNNTIRERRRFLGSLGIHKIDYPATSTCPHAKNVQESDILPEDKKPTEQQKKIYREKAWRYCSIHKTEYPMDAECPICKSTRNR